MGILFLMLYYQRRLLDLCLFVFLRLNVQYSYVGRITIETASVCFACLSSIQEYRIAQRSALKILKRFIPSKKNRVSRHPSPHLRLGKLVLFGVPLLANILLSFISETTSRMEWIGNSRSPFFVPGSILVLTK